MSWMLFFWVAAALLALCRGQNTSYEAVNRSRNVSAKPGSCPTANGLDAKSEDCEWDIDCPGWQKCCPRLGHSFCRDPAGSIKSSENIRYRLNVTVTVETDYQQLMSEDEALLNHTRLLQAMVTEALQSNDVSLYFFSSWAVHTHRTATSLLVDFSVTLPLLNVVSRMRLLLRHIPEVSAVTVEDVNECTEPALHQCSPLADCYNTVGSYRCTCRQGYTDVDPSKPGAHCAADIRVRIATESPVTYLPRTNTTSISDSNTRPNPPGDRPMGLFNSSRARMTIALNNTSSITVKSSHDPQWTHSGPHTSRSSAVELPLPSTTCCKKAPPSITTLQSANVTATSFCIHWFSQINQTYLVVLSKGSEVIHSWKTRQTMTKMRGLLPGVLYNISVTIHACRCHGHPLYILVRTDAQTVEATAQLINIQFSVDLQNTSSQAYKSISETVTEETYQSLSPEMKAKVDSGQVRTEIRSYSPGSVVVIFIFTPRQNQDIRIVSSALLLSLINSSIYTVDADSTNIDDFNECAPGENDCSQWATCTNTWGSYTCECLDGHKDNNPERPGRACQEIVTLDTTPPLKHTVLPTFIATLFSHIKPETIDPALTNVASTPGQNRAVTVPSETVSARVASSPPVSNISIVTTDATKGVQDVNPAQATTTSSSSTTTSAPARFADIVPTTSNTADLVTINTTDATGSLTSSTHTHSSTSDATTTTSAMLSVASNSPALTTNFSNNNASSETSLTLKYTTILGAISIQCRVAAITVSVARGFLLNNKIRDSALYLGLLECGVNGGNATHAELTVAWNECGTSLVHNDTYYTASVILFNIIDSYSSPSGVVETPSIHLEVPIMCTYKKSMLMSSDFGSMGYDMIKDIIVDSGSFQPTVELFSGAVPLSHNYSFSTKEEVLMEVSVNTSLEQVKVIINKCWATPTQNPADTYSYTFLNNSCSLNSSTKVLMNGKSSKSRVSVQIFSLVNLSVVYLHCQVQMCVRIGSNTCAIDCLQRTVQSSNTIGTAYRSVGPLQRSEEKFSEQEYDTVHVVGFSCLGVGLSLFFIVGFVCLFYCQRNRIGHYNFNVRDKEEKFTTLVFNT